MRTTLLLSLVAALGLAACTDGEPSTSATDGQYLNALTGAPCNLDRVSYKARSTFGATTVALNCIGKQLHQPGEGDHPEGDTCCEFPQPGCDANACCEADMVEPQPEGPPVY